MSTLPVHPAPLDAAVRLVMLAALIGIAAILPVQWRLHAKRVWSYLVYCLGYRLLALELDGSMVATVVGFGVKYARI